MSKLTSQDYKNVEKIESITSSKNYLIWVEKRSNEELTGYKYTIRIYDLKNKQTLTDNLVGIQPQISNHEEFIYFISKGEKSGVIQRYSLETGNIQDISDESHKIQKYWISPNNGKILYLTKILRDKNIAEYEDPRIITELVYRTGTDYLIEQMSQQLFVIELEKNELKHISRIDNNYFEANWLDEDFIVTYYLELGKRDISDYKHLVKINVVSGETSLISELYNPYYFLNPVISIKNDKELSIQIYENHYPKAKRAQILKSGIIKDNSVDLINKEFDRSISQIQWISEDEALVLIIRNGFQELMKYNHRERKFLSLYEPQISVDQFTCGNNRIFMITTDPTIPSGIHELEGSELKLIYNPNEEFLSDKEICVPQVYWFTNPEGKKYQGWFFESKSEDRDLAPTILSIHGGPHVQWVNAGSMWLEWQSQVAAGYSVLAMNPVGSDGYGEEFLRVICGEWGQKDARDLLSAVDQLAEKGKIDLNKLFICGGSYAGFQTVNIITKDNRFKAACSQRGVYNLTSMDAGGDIARFDELEYIGQSDHKMIDILWNDSPISKVGSIETPLLLIHSEQDYRVPISQADHLFAEMRRRGKIVKYVRYPREGHELSRGGEPKHVIDRLDKMFDWFNYYLAGK